MTPLELWAEEHSNTCWAKMPGKPPAVAQEGRSPADGQTAVCPSDRLGGESREWTLEEIMRREG